METIAEPTVLDQPPPVQVTAPPAEDAADAERSALIREELRAAIMRKVAAAGRSAAGSR